MALADVIRSGVATAKTILSSGQLLASVTQTSPTGVNEYNEPTGTPTTTTHEALVDRTARVVRDATGVEVVASATLTFFGNITVGYHDTFAVSGETFGRVVQISRGVTPLSGGAFITEVVCG